MKITYLFCILTYVMFFVRNRNSKNFISELLLFSIIAAPGVSIGGELINLFDILLPLLVVYYIFLNGRDISFSKLHLVFLLYAVAALMSVCVNFYTCDNVLISLLQVSRLFYIPVSAAIIHQNSNCLKMSAIQSINVYGVWLGIISIVAFLEQGTIYDSIQFMWINGVEMHRAGGVFAESSYLGVISIILFVSGIYMFGKSKDKLFRVTGLSCSIINIVTNIISYTRITNLILILIILYMIIFMKSWRFKIFIIAGVFILVVTGLVISDLFRAFVFDRLLTVVNIFFDFNSASSGRLDVWLSALKRYFSGSIIFGSGYKNGFFADNNYLMSLTQMGVLGLVVHIYIVGLLIILSIKNKDRVISMIVFTLLVASITCDVLTYYRPMGLVLILLDIQRTNINRNSNFNKYTLNINSRNRGNLSYESAV